MLISQLEPIKPVDGNGRISQVKTMHSFELSKPSKKIEKIEVEINKNCQDESQSNQTSINKLDLAE